MSSSIQKAFAKFEESQYETLKLTIVVTIENLERLVRLAVAYLDEKQKEEVEFILRRLPEETSSWRKMNSKEVKLKVEERFMTMSKIFSEETKLMDGTVIDGFSLLDDNNSIFLSKYPAFSTLLGFMPDTNLHDSILSHAVKLCLGGESFFMTQFRTIEGNISASFALFHKILMDLMAKALENKDALKDMKQNPKASFEKFMHDDEIKTYFENFLDTEDESLVYLLRRLPVALQRINASMKGESLDINWLKKRLPDIKINDATWDDLYDILTSLTEKSSFTINDIRNYLSDSDFWKNVEVKDEVWIDVANKFKTAVSKKHVQDRLKKLSNLNLNDLNDESKSKDVLRSFGLDDETIERYEKKMKDVCMTKENDDQEVSVNLEDDASVIENETVSSTHSSTTD